jgi:Fe2+ or Zn2+ uptake regulation protein
VLVYAYDEFEERVGELAKTPGAKREAVLAAFEAFDSGHTFSIAELEHMCPTVGRATVRRVLNELREQNAVECLGTGRWARWRKL